MQFPSISLKRGQAPSFGVAIPYLHDYAVAARFLEAVQSNPDAAWDYVSSICSQSLDMEALSEMLGVEASYTEVLTAAYVGEPKNCTTRSVYVENPARGLSRVLHLRMVREQGVWKVYSVE